MFLRAVLIVASVFVAGCSSSKSRNLPPEIAAREDEIRAMFNDPMQRKRNRCTEVGKKHMGGNRYETTFRCLGPVKRS